VEEFFMERQQHVLFELKARSFRHALQLFGNHRTFGPHNSGARTRIPQQLVLPRWLADKCRVDLPLQELPYPVGEQLAVLTAALASRARYHGRRSERSRLSERLVIGANRNTSCHGREGTGTSQGSLQKSSTIQSHRRSAPMAGARIRRITFPTG
jgi:hypothetical protein